MMICADNLRYSAMQIAMHESFHYMADADPEIRAEAVIRLQEALGSREALDELAARYQVAYGNIYGDDVDAYIDEILADVYAGTNRAQLGADKYRSVVNSAVMSAARPETKRQQTNRPNTRYTKEGDTNGKLGARDAKNAAKSERMEIEKGRTPRTEEEMEDIIEQTREERKHPDYFKKMEISEEELNRRFGCISETSMMKD